MNHPLYLLRQVGRIPFPSLLSFSLFLTYRFAVIPQITRISLIKVIYQIESEEIRKNQLNLVNLGNRSEGTCEKKKHTALR